MPDLIDRAVRTFFTVLALALICLPLLGLASTLASSHDQIRWGTVPEWVAAFGLLFIGAGIWKIARNGERRRVGSDVRKPADA